MKHHVLSAVLLIASVFCSDLAQAQSRESDAIGVAASSGAFGLTREQGNSWEAWLHHGQRAKREAYAPMRFYDFGRTPALGISPTAHGPGFIGPELSTSSLAGRTDVDPGLVKTEPVSDSR